MKQRGSWPFRAFGPRLGHLVRAWIGILDCNISMIYVRHFLESVRIRKFYVRFFSQ